MTPLPDFETVTSLFTPVAERARLQRDLGLSAKMLNWRLAKEYQNHTGPYACLHTNHENGHGPHIAMARHSPWLSEHLGRPVLHIRHLIGLQETERINALKILLKRLKEEYPNGLVILRSPTSCVALNQAFSACQFDTVGVELTGSIKLDQRPIHPNQIVGSNIRFTELSMGDLIKAQEIAAQTHSHNHFEYCPKINNEKAKTLFKEQVARQFSNERSQLIGAYSNQQLLGFIVANKVYSFLDCEGPLLGNLDFICVDPNSQLKGLGYALNLAALDYLFKQGVRRVTVRTMVCNFPAQSILRRTGWRAMLAESVFHCFL